MCDGGSGGGECIVKGGSSSQPLSDRRGDSSALAIGADLESSVASGMDGLRTCSGRRYGYIRGTQKQSAN